MLQNNNLGQAEMFSNQPHKPIFTSLPKLFFLLPVHTLVCYWRVDHEDEGWVAGMDFVFLQKKG